MFLNVSKNSCEVIGTGSLSTVRRCREKTSGKCFALKARHGAPSGVELRGFMWFLYGFNVVFTWCWYVFSMVFLCTVYMVLICFFYGFSMVFLCGVYMVLICFFYGLSMVFLCGVYMVLICFFYGFSMVFLCGVYMVLICFFNMVFICFDVHKWASWMHLMQRNVISNGWGVSQNDQTWSVLMVWIEYLKLW